jgi:hypothetical protein
MQWRARLASWDARLKNGNGHAWAGLIPALSPRLERPNIETLDRYGLWYLNAQVNDRYGGHRLEKLFGYASEDASFEDRLLPNLSMIAGLRRLRELYLLGQKLDAS